MVRQELRPLMGSFAARRIDMRDGHRLAARCRDTIQGVRVGRSEDDHLLAAPRAALTRGCVRQHLRGPARHGNLLELPVGEEAQKLPIRRPERRIAVDRRRERLRCGGLEPADPEQVLPRLRGRERYVATVRRDGHAQRGGTVHGRLLETSLFRRQ